MSKTGLHSVGYTDDGFIWLAIDLEIMGRPARLKLDLPLSEVDDFVKKVKDAAHQADQKMVIPKTGLVQ